MRAKTVVAIVTMIVAAGSMWHWAPIAQGQARSCLVATAQGDVQGIDRGEVCEFRGVPFAAPPVGALRWTPPVPATPWAPVVLDGTISPPSCLLFNQAGMPAGNEDCLKLNIWAPHAASRRPLPVIVWLHPGSFIAASANTATWNGQLFVEETNAIVVIPNYRLGPFGFLGHRALRRENPDYPSAGNYGFLDQRLAMEWVRAHIASFGGDPNRITIAGQSAGGLSVSLHLVSPRSHWLFDRAIMQGGFASYRWRTREDAEAQGDEFATALGCSDPTEVLTCLRAKTPADVLRALPIGTEQFAETGRTHWGPVVDGLEIPDQPRTLYEIGAFHRVPIIIGSNRDEGWTWVSRSFPGVLTDAQYESALETEFGVDAQAIMAAYPYPTAENDSAKDTLAQIVTDAEYACGATRLAGLIERTGTPVYLYSFDYAVEAVAPDRAVHGLDVQFVFGTPIGPPLTPTSIPLNSDDLELARSIAGYWKRFAETGNPNRTKQARGRSDWSSATEDTEAAAVHWPAFNRPTGKGRGADKYLILDLPIKADKRLREAQCGFWEPFFFRSITAAVPAHTP